MATATGLPTGNGRTRHHPSPVLTFVGPLLLLAGGILAIAGTFLPWWHFQICDSSAESCQPYVPAGVHQDPTVLVLYVIVVVALAASFFSLILHGLPGLRSKPMLLLWAILLGVAALVVALFGTGWMALISVFLNFLAVDTKILDSGYFLALAGFVLLVPGSLVLVVTESRWRVATIPVPVIVSGAGRPKSLRRGLLLETLVPGTGAAYAGRSGMALGWWLGTSIGGPLLCLAVGIPINALDGLADNATENALSLFPAAAIVLVLLLLTGSWLAARLWVVSGWLRSYNQSLGAAQTPVPPPIVRTPALGAFDAGLVISSTAAALGVSVFILMIGSLMPIDPPLNPLQTLAELIPPAYWLALVSLRQSASTPTAFGKTLVWVAGIGLAILLTSLALDAALVPNYSTTYLNLSDVSTRTLLLVGLFTYVLPVLLAGSTGFGLATFFADWREVRRQLGGQAAHLRPLLPYGIPPLLGIMAFLPLAALHRELVLDVRETHLHLFLSLYVLIPLAGCMWIIGTAALQSQFGD